MNANGASTILRWGLAFVLFYAGVESLRHPEMWAGQSSHLLGVGFAVYEAALAVWLFWGKRLAWSSILATATFALLTLASLGDLSGVYGDIGLAMAGLALFELARGKRAEADDEA